MPFVLIFIGALFFITAIRGTSLLFVQMLQDDIFTTKSGHSFFFWAIAILIVGALGYIKSIRPLSDSFLLLLIIVLFLSNGGVFSQFNQALAGATQTNPPGTLNTSINAVMAP